MDNVCANNNNSNRYIQRNFNGIASSILKSKHKSFLEKNNEDTVHNKINTLIKVLIPKINEDIEENSPYLKDLHHIDILLQKSNTEGCIELFDDVKNFAKKYIRNDILIEELAESIASYNRTLTELENQEKLIREVKSKEYSLPKNEQHKKYEEIATNDELTEIVNETSEINQLTQHLERLRSISERELTKVYGYTKAIIKIVQEIISIKEQKFEEFYEAYLQVIVENEYSKIIENLELSNNLGIPLSILLGCDSEGDCLNTCDIYIQDMDKFRELSKQEMQRQIKENERHGHAYSASGAKTFQNDFLFYLNMFKDNKPLTDFLDSLGRKMGLNKAVEESYEEAYISSKSNDIESKDYRERISGITFDKQFEYMLPQELALLSDPDVELLFKLKFLENRVTCFDLDSVSKIFDNEEKTRQSTRKRDEETRGPVIVAIDTSGSMQGLPENYAKAVTLVLALKCLDAKRCLYTINFANTISCMKFDYSKKKESLQDLKKFLRLSYNGGTENMNATLTETFRKMDQDKDFKNADMLVCTDAYYTSYINEDLIENAINRNIKNNTGFYELIVGRNPSPTKLFFNTIYTLDNGKLTVIDFDK